MFSRPAPAVTEAWPPEPHGTVNLEAQTRAAYGAVGARMFRGGAPGAELERSMEDAFARAAAVAADELESAFEDPPQVASWSWRCVAPTGRSPTRPSRRLTSP